ncbi:MAG: potassium/proton antiporter [Cyclobacteriaceae bacterium]|nr:potassium/proton antiporter [Cyclobacteriaceae bacterium]
MQLTAENILLLTSILLFLSILASKTSYKLGVPALLMFLLMGMLAGSEGIGKITFNDPNLTQFIGVIALNFILFSGGLDTKWESVRPVLAKGVILSTLGVLITAIALGLFAYYVMDFTILEGLLLAATVSSTDAAAVFSILRGNNIGLKKNLGPTLELESGSNDPMAYFLVLTFIMLIKQPDSGITVLIPFFIKQMIIGGGVGYLMGKAMPWVINKIKLDVDGLYPVLITAMVLFTFSVTDFAGGNGFLAVYISSVILGNSNFIHKKSLIRFYDGVSWLMQIIIFLTLGLLVFPSEIPPIVGPGILLSVFLIFAARPISVFVSLAFFRMRFREKLFLSWVGLRGAVPIVFATYPLVEGIEKAGLIFNIVFLLTVSSVLIQGTTIPLVAKWLGLAVPEKIKKRSPLELELVDSFKSELLEVELNAKNPVVGKSIVQLDFPKTAIIIMVNRNGKFIRPGGSTVLEGGDKLAILADNKESIPKIYEALNMKQSFV